MGRSWPDRQAGRRLAEQSRSRKAQGVSGREAVVFYEPRLLWFQVTGNPTQTSLKHWEIVWAHVIAKYLKRSGSGAI